MTNKKKGPQTVQEMVEAEALRRLNEDIIQFSRDLDAVAQKHSKFAGYLFLSIIERTLNPKPVLKEEKETNPFADDMNPQVGFEILTDAIGQTSALYAYSKIYTLTEIAWKDDFTQPIIKRLLPSYIDKVMEELQKKLFSKKYPIGDE